MNQKDFDKLVKESMDKYNEKESELDALLAAAEKKQEELEKFRDDLLLNLIHADINADEEENEEENEPPSASMKFVGEIPTSEELAESQAVVVHVMPGFLDADDESDNIDLIYLSKEDGLSDEEMCGALAFATVKAFIKSSEAMAKRDGADAEFENINYDEIVDAVMEKIGEVVVKQSLRDCLRDLFDFDKED